MNPSPSFSSIFEDFETVDAIESFSRVSGTLAGHNWELKDLLNKEDNVGSDCPDVEGGPVNEAG